MEDLDKTRAGADTWRLQIIDVKGDTNLVGVFEDRNKYSPPSTAKNSAENRAR